MGTHTYDSTDTYPLVVTISDTAGDVTEVSSSVYTKVAPILIDADDGLTGAAGLTFTQELAEFYVNNDEMAPATGELTRLPVGNQIEVLQTARREGLSSVEVAGVVDLLLGSFERSKHEYVLAQPRHALAETHKLLAPPWDPRLSRVGNHAGKQLARLLEQLARMEAWLAQRSRAELRACDRLVLWPSLERLAEASRRVADLAEELRQEDVP